MGDNGRPVRVEFPAYARRVDAFHTRQLGLAIDNWVLSNIGRSCPDSILDYGCGTGVMLQKLRKAYPNSKLNGIEPNADLAVIAISRNVQVRVDESPDYLISVDQHFSEIICMSVLGHCDNPRQTLRSIKHLMRYSSRLSLAVPNCLFDWVMAVPNMFNGYRTDESIKHKWTPRELVRMVEHSGFMVSEIVGLGPKALGISPVVGLQCWRVR